MSATTRAAKVMKPKNLKEAGVDFSNAKKGFHTLTETYATRSSPFHRGATASRSTTVGPHGSTSSTTFQPAQLTRTGKRTAAGAAVAGAAGLYTHDKKKVSKSMSISFWGVDHAQEVSKADKKQPGPTIGRRILASTAPGIHPLVAGKKGKKLRAFGYEAGGSFVGQVAGAGLTRGNHYGTAAGGVIGSQAGLNRAQKKGYLKKQDPDDF